MESTQIKKLSEVSIEPIQLTAEWDLRIVKNEDNLTYCLINHTSKEAIWVDPMREDQVAQNQVNQELKGYRFITVIDTHTHADHISNAADLATQCQTVLLMHEKAPSRKIHLKVQRDLSLPTASSPVEIWITPGHTQDGITVQWGPFLCTGDTILFNDTGRDDLPTGDPTAHYESLQKIKSRSKKNSIFLTGHDAEARISTWGYQLKNNPALSQSLEEYLKDGGSYVGKSPKLLKESLYENFK